MKGVWHTLLLPLLSSLLVASGHTGRRFISLGSGNSEPVGNCVHLSDVLNDSSISGVLLTSAKRATNYVDLQLDYLQDLVNNRAEPRWISASTDPYLSLNFFASVVEQYDLLRGELRPRIDCIKGNLHQKECKYARLRDDYRIYTPLPIVALSMEQWMYLFDFADDLFNSQLYGHAEAWCYYLLQQIQVGYEPNDIAAAPSVAAMTTAQHRLLVRGSLILMEVSRLKGKLCLAVDHAVWIVHSHSVLVESEAGVQLTDYGLVARLRLLLAIPPVPPNYATAAVDRVEMLADLQRFTARLRVMGTSLALEVSGVLVYCVQLLPHKYRSGFYSCRICPLTSRRRRSTWPTKA
jgi:hypothetical protein